MYEYLSVSNIYVLINSNLKVLNSVAQYNVETKIRSFAKLATGWDYGRGGPIPATTIRLALSWSRFLRDCGLLQIDAFPGGDSEIVVSGCRSDHYCEVIIEPDHTISIAYDFKNMQVYYKPNLSELDAKQTILEVRWHIWNAFDCYILTSSIVGKINLHGPLSGMQKTTGNSLSWTVNALSAPAHQYAPIFANTINVFQELYGNLQFSGSLPQIFCQQDQP